MLEKVIYIILAKELSEYLYNNFRIFFYKSWVTIWSFSEHLPPEYAADYV